MGIALICALLSNVVCIALFVISIMDNRLESELQEWQVREIEHLNKHIERLNELYETGDFC